MKKMLAFLLCFNFVLHGTAQVKTVREQANIVNDILSDRLNNLLPSLMAKNNIDCWVLITREYNEDPIVKTMLPAEWLSARRRTVLVFYNNPKTGVLEKYAIARYAVGKEIKAAWDVAKTPDQWTALASLLKQIQPNQIAVNMSSDFGHADGLDHTEYVEFMSYLSKEQQSKVISSQPLAVAWLETRTEKEMAYYPTLLKITHDIIKEGFSNKVIKVDKSTTTDLEWWFRQKLSDLGLTTWFHPSVEIQRRSANTSDNTIHRGDFLHVDFGITYLRLNSDVQEQAYVLLSNEKEVPENLVRAFEQTNQLQDILTNNFATGKTGNEILLSALNTAKAKGIQPSIYTHPIGAHGHAAGPTIGMWDMQNGVPGSGDYKMNPNTCYSIELNATHNLKDWSSPVRVALEQNGYFNGTSFKYIDGRQTKIIPIKFD
jgi:Xaa-Pro aminopeptidase